MDHNQFLPPRATVQPQFFPPPNIAFNPALPPPGFHVPPPNVPPFLVETHENLDSASIETIVIDKRNETEGRKSENDIPQIKVHEFSERIQKFYCSLNRLKHLLEDYKSRQNDIDCDTNDLRTKIIAEQECMSELKASMSIYFENIQVLKTKISKRRRKRRKKFIRPVSFDARQIAADHMQRLLRIATDVEQDEKLKKDADNILSDVLRKKNEANNCIRLLSTLEKLHAARSHSMGTTSRGFGFIAVIEKLKTLWESRLQEYAVEENGFRVMIEELAMDRKKESNENRDKIFEEWCKSIFGVPDFRAFSYHTNVEDFVRIRHSWDKYIVEDNDTNTKIPPGWVLPENKCSDSAWKKFIYKR